MKESWMHYFIATLAIKVTTDKNYKAMFFVFDRDRMMRETWERYPHLNLTKDAHGVVFQFPACKR